MIEITDKKECVGCTACQSICPKHCIRMEYDSEGYKYPVAEKSVCINCGLCEKVCPCLNVQTFDEFKTRAFAVQTKDRPVRLQSASGGAFSVLAEKVLQDGGVVYGGAFDKAFNVVHVRVETVRDLERLRGSKYVQSEMEGIFPMVKADLESGRKVLFSGTPCQLAGLQRYLHGKTDNLLRVDLVCHGIPSPRFWSYIVCKLSERYGRLQYCAFRNKHFGYAGSTMAMQFADGKMRYMGRDIQLYKKLFFDDINTRPSCFACHFKTIKRNTDFTIYDCWHVNEIDRRMDDDCGTTWLLVQSERGMHFFNGIADKFRYAEAPVDKAIKLDGLLATTCTTPNVRRSEFFNECWSMELDALVAKYFPLTLKKRMVMLVKPILGKMGLIKVLKRLGNG